MVYTNPYCILCISLILYEMTSHQKRKCKRVYTSSAAFITVGYFSCQKIWSTYQIFSTCTTMLIDQKFSLLSLRARNFIFYIHVLIYVISLGILHLEIYFPVKRCVSQLTTTNHCRFFVFAKIIVQAFPRKYLSIKFQRIRDKKNKLFSTRDRNLSQGHNLQLHVKSFELSQTKHENTFLYAFS